MFAAESASVRVSSAPLYAATLFALHVAAAVAPALAGLAWPFALPAAIVILYRGAVCARREGLRGGGMAIRHVEVRSDGRVHLRTGDGQEGDARLGPDTWITPWFIVLDLRSPLPGLPHGLLLTRGDADGFRRLTVLLRWCLPGRETTRPAALRQDGSP